MSAADVSRLAEWLTASGWWIRSTNEGGPLWAKGVHAFGLPFDAAPGHSDWKDFITRVATVEGLHPEPMTVTTVLLGEDNAERVAALLRVHGYSAVEIAEDAVELGYTTAVTGDRIVITPGPLLGHVIEGER